MFTPIGAIFYWQNPNQNIDLIPSTLKDLKSVCYSGFIIVWPKGRLQSEPFVMDKWIHILAFDIDVSQLNNTMIVLRPGSMLTGRDKVC